MKTEAQLKQTIKKLSAEMRLARERVEKVRDEVSRRFEQPVMRKNIGKCYKHESPKPMCGKNGEVMKVERKKPKVKF